MDAGACGEPGAVLERSRHGQAGIELPPLVGGEAGAFEGLGRALSHRGRVDGSKPRS